MKSLSQSEYEELRDLYNSVYETEEIIEEEFVHEICEELVEELVAEGYSEEDAIVIVEDAANDYIDEAKVTFGSDTAPIRKSGAPVGARRRYGMRKAADALQGAKKAAGSAYKTAKSQAAGAALAAVGTAKMAKDSAGEKITATKKKASEVKQAVKDAPEKAKVAVTTAVSDAKKKTKSGIKGFIKRQAQKVVSRMSEENVEIEEGMKPLPKNKMFRKAGNLSRDVVSPSVTDDQRQKAYDRSKKIVKTLNKANEELEATGLFSEKEIADIEEAMSSYDKNRKRAAQRAADRNAARAAGKTGVVPGVGYVTPNKERETYTDEKGTVRHKSGAKNE